MEPSEIAAIVVMVPGLIYLTIEDIRHKKISLMVIVAIGVILTGISIWQRNGALFILTGLIPGLLAIGFSFISKGGLGLGDALLLLAAGPYLGLWDSLAVLMTGLLMASLFGIFMMLFKKAHLRTALPFVPFYLGGFAIWEAAKWIF